MVRQRRDAVSELLKAKSDYVAAVSTISLLLLLVGTGVYAKDETTAQAFNNKGVKLLNSHDYEGSVKALQKAVELSEPDSRQQMTALNNLSVALHTLGRIDEENEAVAKAEKIWAKIKSGSTASTSTGSSPSTTTSPSSRAATTTRSASSASSFDPGAPITKFLSDVRHELRQRYVPPKEGMNPPLVVVRISKTGNIVDAEISRNSDPPIWGKSLVQAVKNAAPLQPPEGSVNEFLDVAIDGSYDLKVTVADPGDLPESWH